MTVVYKFDGVNLIPLTQVELDVYNNINSENLRYDRKNKWQNEMENMDKNVARVVEDIYEVLSQAQKDALPADFKNKVAAKKAKRAERP